MEKIALVIDNGWDTVNGVVTSMKQVKQVVEKKGFHMDVIHSGQFRNFPMPTYPEFRMSLVLPSQLAKILKHMQPDHIHIATEGLLGLVARRACIKNNWKFTTAYHTHLPEYVDLRIKGFKKATYRYLRWFHRPSQKVFVSTPSLKRDLEDHGFKNLVVTPLGVDTELFQNNPKATLAAGLKHPVFVYMGRIAPEKNLPAFLDCNLPGSKLIIGDGPDKQKLERKYTKAKFVGYKKGQELVDFLSMADVFVTPSLTETFGLTTIEALSCGLPVAAFHSSGLKDIVTQGVDGYLGENLADNAVKCLQLDHKKCRDTALRYSWERAGQAFLENLAPI